MLLNIKSSYRIALCPSSITCFYRGGRFRVSPLTSRHCPSNERSVVRRAVVLSSSLRGHLFLGPPTTSTVQPERTVTGIRMSTSVELHDRRATLISLSVVCTPVSSVVEGFDRAKADNPAVVTPARRVRCTLTSLRSCQRASSLVLASSLVHSSLHTGQRTRPVPSDRSRPCRPDSWRVRWWLLGPTGFE